MYKHGMVRTPVYETWHQMKKRCYNENSVRYKHYGGRGITVCDRWRYSFLNFYKDMGDKPFKGAHIDRIDNDGNYEPGNCRWVTLTENNRNKSNNVTNMYTARSLRRVHKLHRFSTDELCKIYNLGKSTVKHIIYNQRWKEAIDV